MDIPPKDSLTLFKYLFLYEIFLLREGGRPGCDESSGCMEYSSALFYQSIKFMMSKDSCYCSFFMLVGNLLDKFITK